MPGDKEKGLGRSPGSNDRRATPRGRNHLFVIAIDDYTHCPKLNNCVKDAQDFIATLTGQYQFEPARIYTLYNEAATRRHILGGLRDLRTKVRPEDNLVLYYSGHGDTEAATGAGYWIPVDADPSHYYEFVSSFDIKAELNAINSFHTFVIVDACFSGSLFATFRDIRPGYETKRSRLGLASSHSRERAMDGAPGDNSPFAEVLLRQLRHHPADLTVHDLAAAVIREVEGRTQSRQTPVFKPLDVRGDDAGQFVFHRRQALPAWQQDWEAVAALPDATESQVTQKILRIDDYLHQHADAENIDDAATLGEWLECKRDFILAQTSLIRLRLFARRNTPFQAEALERIEALKKGYVLPPESEGEDSAPARSEPHTEKKAPPKLVKSSPTNTFTDPRDGQVYRTIELNGRVWLAQNLNFYVGEGCWFYDNDPKKGEEYGRLYTWEAAKRACPPGWRLPTKEEWDQLTKQLGGSEGAYKALIKGGSTGFSALVGGSRFSDGSFSSIGYYGYYWTTEEYKYDAGNAWYYYFRGDTVELIYSYSTKRLGFSCRCVQD